jgi:tRNA threonylcarbamoyladenosine biosynthesis protein TsaE
MSRTELLKLVTGDPAETRNVGEAMGSIMHPGCILTLRGDLGSGKTTLVQGIARGLGLPADYYITSPSYSIINEYPGRLVIHHVDLYRLHSVEELEDIGLEEILGSDSVVVIEWPERVESALLNADLQIHLRILSSTSREIEFFSYGLKGKDLLVPFAKQWEGN